MKLSFTTTVTELEYDVQPPPLVAMRYAYIPAVVSLNVAVVEVSAVDTQVAPESTDRCHTIDPEVLAEFNMTFPLPIQAGFEVANVMVPAIGAAVTVKILPSVADGSQTDSTEPEGADITRTKIS